MRCEPDLAKRRQMVGDAKEEDHADDAAIGCAGPRDDVVKAGMVAAHLEGATHGSCHHGIHRNQAYGKGGKTEHATRGATKIGSEKKQGELAGRFGTDSMEHANHKYGLPVVHPLKPLWTGDLAVEEATHTPRGPENAVDGDRETALDSTVRMSVGISTEDAGYDADSEHDEGEANEALGPVVESLRQAHMELKHGNPEGRHGERMAESVGCSQSKTAAPCSLNGGNVGDRGQVIVVKPMTQSEQQAGAKRGSEFPIAHRESHARSIEQNRSLRYGDGR